MQSWHLVEKVDAFEVAAEVRLVGDDLLVVLSGGTRPHIGAVGLAEPRPSLQEPSLTSATSSVFTFPGHREDDLAKQQAEQLARQLGRKVVVVAGMHWDELPAQAIPKVLALCQRLTAAIVAAVKCEVRRPGETRQQ